MACGAPPGTDAGSSPVDFCASQAGTCVDFEGVTLQQLGVPTVSTPGASLVVGAVPGRAGQGLTVTFLATSMADGDRRAGLTPPMTGGARMTASFAVRPPELPSGRLLLGAVWSAPLAAGGSVAGLLLEGNSVACATWRGTTETRGAAVPLTANTWRRLSIDADADAGTVACALDGQVVSTAAWTPIGSQPGAHVGPWRWAGWPGLPALEVHLDEVTTQ